MPQATVTIAQDGTVVVEAHGVRGQGCAALTRAIEESLGQTTSDVKKPEYFQAQAVQTQTAGGKQ